METTRYSKQRELILLELKSRCDHPTAEQIYFSLKKQCPELSLGTVYRNLGVLTKNKQIKKLDIGNGCFHYDGNITPHIHYVCNCCHQIIDLTLDTCLLEQIKHQIDQQVDSIQIQLNGICQQCQHKINQD